MTIEQRKAVISDIKQVPQDPALRAAIRRVATGLVETSGERGMPSRAELEAWGRATLSALALPEHFLGFAMVAVNNAVWQAAFSSIPPSRRLLLLPHCLRDAADCAGAYDSVGLRCAGCRRCDIAEVKAEAEALGYQVIVAEGTSSVLMKVLDGEADAILGVACLDSLEKSYLRIADLGIPNMAVPLLNDGCLDTETEWEEVRALLRSRADVSAPRARGYVPLLRETTAIFTPDSLAVLLNVDAGLFTGAQEQLNFTDAVALDWLRRGGKRLRPFVTVAAYAVGKHGNAALEPDAPVRDMVPDAVRRLAVSIEALHKASLVHDDIEDEEAERYDGPTLHRVHGVASAINFGDYLVGLGYRLIAGEAPTLGADCVSDILLLLSSAHLDLCRGQGTELQQRRRPLRPADVLAIYALKTAPAFEVALYAGLRAAGVALDLLLLKRFTLYLGEGYQIADDLHEWREAHDDARLGRELALGAPTILHAFALAANDDRLNLALAVDDPLTRVARVRELYSELDAFTQAARLRDRLRARALGLLDDVAEPALRDLLAFLARVVLPEDAWTAGPRG